MDEQPEIALEGSRSTNGKAVVSLVLGLIGLTGVLFVAAIVAIVLGKRSRLEIESSDQRGAPLATMGIVLGWIGLAWATALSVYVALGMTEVL